MPVADPNAAALDTLARRQCEWHAAASRLPFPPKRSIRRLQVYAR